VDKKIRGGHGTLRPLAGPGRPFLKKPAEDHKPIGELIVSGRQRQGDLGAGQEKQSLEGPAHCTSSTRF